MKRNGDLSAAIELLPEARKRGRPHVVKGLEGIKFNTKDKKNMKPVDTFDPDSKTLVFKFSNKAAALHFKDWLCGSGEQQYWNWMEYRESDEPKGNITGLSFNYHTGTEVVEVTCGRMDSRNQALTDQKE